MLGLEFLKPKKQPAKELYACGLPVELRHYKTSKKLRLRLDSREDIIIISAPKRASQKEIKSFLARHESWIMTQLAKRPPAILFENGAVIPFCGKDYKIKAVGGKASKIYVTAAEIVVSGDEKKLSKRLNAWLRKEARRLLTDDSALFAAYIDKKIAPISIRDTKSRWGSCSASGGLNFSWRLVLAPSSVRQYVVAHEVAHLKYRHHGVEFWDLCDRLCQKQNIDMKKSRLWLRKNGAALMRIGVTPENIKIKTKNDTL